MTTQQNIDQLAAEVERLTNAIKLSKNREEHIQLTTEANEATTLLRALTEHVQITME
jgi:hypothetical protein